MPAATRLLAAFLLLVAAFLVLVGFAVFGLVSAGQHTMAAVVCVAGLAGVLAGAATYWLLRRDVIALDGDYELEVPDVEPTRVAAAVTTPLSAAAALEAATRRMPRRPLRVQSMPVANLPPAYLNAVMRGAQARLSALKAESSGAEPR